MIHSSLHALTASAVILFAWNPPRLWRRRANWRARPGDIWLPIAVLLAAFRHLDHRRNGISALLD